MKPWQTQILNTMLTSLTAAGLAYFGFISPQQESQAAVDQCCPLARECIEKLE